jgi:hypothetical protein
MPICIMAGGKQLVSATGDDRQNSARIESLIEGNADAKRVVVNSTHENAVAVLTWCAPTRTAALSADTCLKKDYPRAPCDRQYLRDLGE